MENAFIIYETPPQPLHDMIISPPIYNYLPINYVSKNMCPPWGVKEIASPFQSCPVNREFSWKKTQTEKKSSFSNDDFPYF